MIHNTNQKKTGHMLSIVISLLISGFGVGWLIGLSVSPTVSILITSITGTLVAMIAALSGLDKSNRWKIEPWPMAVLILGILAGSIVGINARNQNWLGRDMKAEAARWNQAGLRLTQDQILARFFETAYPLKAVSSTNGETHITGNQSGTILYSLGQEECESYKAEEGDQLRGVMRTSAQPLIRLLADIKDDTELKNIVEKGLCPNK